VENSKFQTLGSYCQCRWYSLWKFLRNGLALRVEINQFLIKHGSPTVPNSVFTLMEQLFPIVVTGQMYVKMEDDTILIGNLIG
jgi:hypothetical protein